MPLSAQAHAALAVALASPVVAAEIKNTINNPDNDAGNNVFTGTGNVTMAAGQKVQVVNKTSGAATTVTLPPNPTAWQTALVKDGKGDAGTNNITVHAASGNIDGRASIVIKNNYGSAWFIYNGTRWNTINLDFWDALSDLLVPGTLTVSGQAAFAAGTGTGTYPPEGLINSQTNNVGTGADTTEDTLHTYNLPANSLSANGKGIRIYGWGTTAANANAKTLKVYFGSLALTIASAVAANPKPWNFELEIRRVGVGSQTYCLTGQFNGAIVATQVGTASQDETTDLTLKTTGTNGTASANDLTEANFTVEFLN